MTELDRTCFRHGFELGEERHEATISDDPGNAMRRRSEGWMDASTLISAEGLKLRRR